MPFTRSSPAHVLPLTATFATAHTLFTLTLNLVLAHRSRPPRSRMPQTLPYVSVSPSETSKVFSTRPQLDRKRPSPAKTVGRKSGGRGDPLLACLNCRQKKVKVQDSCCGPTVAYSGFQCQSGTYGCSRCLKLGLQCVEPDMDERKRYVESHG